MLFCLVLFELLIEITITFSSVRFCFLNEQPQGDTGASSSVMFQLLFQVHFCFLPL